MAPRLVLRQLPDVHCRHSRGGGNPRTDPARQHVSREIVACLPTANVAWGLIHRFSRY